MTPGLFLFIEGAVVRNNWGQMNLEFKIRNIDLLNELGVKRSKGLKLRINSTDVNDSLIATLEKVCNQHSGNTPLYVKVFDQQENITLELLSRKFRVNPVNDLVKQIKNLKELDVEVVY
jgi:DNA polymerase-3 subunit alpha